MLWMVASPPTQQNWKNQTLIALLLTFTLFCWGFLYLFSFFGVGRMGFRGISSMAPCTATSSATALIKQLILKHGAHPSSHPSLSLSIPFPQEGRRRSSFRNCCFRYLERHKISFQATCVRRYHHAQNACAGGWMLFFLQTSWSSNAARLEHTILTPRLWCRWTDGGICCCPYWHHHCIQLVAVS